MDSHTVTGPPGFVLMAHNDPRLVDDMSALLSSQDLSIWPKRQMWNRYIQCHQQNQQQTQARTPRWHIHLDGAVQGWRGVLSCQPWKMFSGRLAATAKLGMSTTSANFKSTATLASMYASTLVSPRVPIK